MDHRSLADIEAAAGQKQAPSPIGLSRVRLIGAAGLVIAASAAAGGAFGLVFLAAPTSPIHSAVGGALFGLSVVLFAVALDCLGFWNRNE